MLIKSYSGKCKVHQETQHFYILEKQIHLNVSCKLQNKTPVAITI